ncbi:coiled-coil domain-containing protein 172 isoform X3 [Cebidichthys violaceus]|uniref:coiled-coil domain-containing protein 172 isoform X3 n=1 Tax=Cebidichthys violaceus TaxID=271503 RepID=UPI0035CAFC6B
MSLDTLFQQILQTEQQLTEQTQKIKEVKVAIIRCNEKIKSATEKNKKTSEELDKKAQQLSAMRLQHGLMKKREDQMLKQIGELLRQRSQRRERLAKMKRRSEEEEEKFLHEISRFNSDFSLCGNRGVVFESQTHSETLDLQREVEALREDLDRQTMEAEATTESLRAESLSASRKPLTDTTCLRLRTELEKHKEGDLELLREALGSEIHFLKSQKLDSSQGSEQR